MTRTGHDKNIQVEFKPQWHQGIQTDYFDPEEAVKLRKELKHQKENNEHLKSDNRVLKEEIERLKTLMAKTDRNNEK